MLTLAVALGQGVANAVGELEIKPEVALRLVDVKQLDDLLEIDLPQLRVHSSTGAHAEKSDAPRQRFEIQLIKRQTRCLCAERTR